LLSTGRRTEAAATCAVTRVAWVRRCFARRVTRAPWARHEPVARQPRIARVAAIASRVWHARRIVGAMPRPVVALAPRAIAVVVAAALACTAPAAPPAPSPRATPLVIAHRGASGHRPEHTLAAYALAIDMGADYVEPDLVSTRDGVLVARHENEIGGTTDVAARFPERRRTKTVDGRLVTGWFTEDFTLAELRTLRARERLPYRSRAHDGVHPIPTLDEVLDLVARRARELGRPIGVYPETKHPSYFRGIGLPLEEPLLAALARRGWTGRDAPVFIQSFEVGNLRGLRTRTGVRLVQLVAPRGAPPDAPSGSGYAAMLTPGGLRAVARYADGIGAEQSLVQPRAAGGALAAPTTLVRDAHAAGLAVHVWTLRRDDPGIDNGPAEWRRLAALGVDGIFGDFPDDGVAALRGGTPRPSAPPARSGLATDRSGAGPSR
jgi:glycerophosphoryl diester phosphodiesterase